MKTIITLILSIIFSLNASAYCRVDTAYYFEIDPASAIKAFTARNINYFNSANQLIQTDNQNWDFLSASFVNNRRTNYALDAAGNTIIKQISNWNAVTNVWDNRSKETFTYNVANLVLTRLSENWDAVSGAWLHPWTELSYTYNIANKMLSETKKNWIDASSSWRVINITYYTFDAASNLTEEFGLQYDAALSSLMNTYKNLNTYNAANLLVQQIKQKWSVGIWANEKRELYTYNASGLLTDQITQLYIGSIWTNSSKSTYTYTTFDSVNFEEKSEWSILGFSWSTSARLYYTYDASKQLTENRAEVFSASTSSWINSYKITKEYNSTQDLIAEDQYVGWSATTGYYREHTRAEYVCATSTGIENFTTDSFLKIYPNPLTGGPLFIDSKAEDNYKLININGQLLQSGNLKKGTNTIDVSGLPADFYFIKVGTVVKKLIIQ